MTTELTEQQQAEAAFLAAASDDAPAATPAQVATPEEPTPAVAEPETPPEAIVEPPPEPVIAGFKESEVRAMLARVKELDDLRAENRKNFGQIGELKRTLEEKLKQPTTLPTPSPGFKLNQEKLAQVREIFPEIAEMFEFEQEQAAAAAEVPPQPAVDPAEIERRLQETANQQLQEAAAAIQAETDRKLAIQMLDFRHPDRLQFIETDDYKAWLANLKPEEREQVQTSWDVKVIADKLDAAKAWAKAKQQKQQRLEAAVVPSGSTKAPATALTAEQAFLRSFDGG